MEKKIQPIGCVPNQTKICIHQLFSGTFWVYFSEIIWK